MESPPADEPELGKHPTRLMRQVISPVLSEGLRSIIANQVSICLTSIIDQKINEFPSGIPVA
jgi:hypothetical protein